MHEKPTKKRASTALNIERSMSTPTRVLLIHERPLHTARACLSRLFQRRAFCCRLSNWPLCTGNTPCKAACGGTRHTSPLHSHYSQSYIVRACLGVLFEFRAFCCSLLDWRLCWQDIMQSWQCHAPHSYTVNRHTYTVTCVQSGLYSHAYMVIPHMNTVIPVLSHLLCTGILTQSHLVYTVTFTQSHLKFTQSHFSLAQPKLHSHAFTVTPFVSPLTFTS